MLNYQREVPPFAQIELSFAQDHFDEIYYITPHLKNDNSGSIKKYGVKVLEISSVTRYVTLMRLLSLFLRREVLLQIMESMRRSIFSMKYLKSLSIELFSAEQLYVTVKKLIRPMVKNDKIVIMSCWFSGIAYAAAKLHKTYPQITAVSLAHSYEINPSRNPFVAYKINTYKHRYLSNVSFIAQAMYNIYHKATKYKFQNSKTSVDYLGCKKLFDVKSVQKKGIFHICSCSSMVKVKRINFILEALSLWQDSEIQWTHIGDGPEYGYLLTKAKTLMSHNRNIRILFLGKLSNENVQKFYRDNYIDLFVNVSEIEGLPVSIMEALAYGIPCLATNVGGTNEIVNESTGILISKDSSPKQIYEAIRSYYDLDDVSKLRLREQCYKFWALKFNAVRNVNVFFANLLNNYKPNVGETE